MAVNVGVGQRRDGGESEERRKKKACLVQEPFNNFLWKLKKEIVWGRIAGGGEMKPI